MGPGRLGEEYMEHINWLGVVLGALAFFAVGAIWYTVLFGKPATSSPAWPRSAGFTCCSAEFSRGRRTRSLGSA